MQFIGAGYKEKVGNSELKFHTFNNYETYKGKNYEQLKMSYQLFGKALSSAPVIAINHALTGNSDVISEKKGWWKDLVGPNKLIDTNRYTIIAFNILGNGYDGYLIENYNDFIAKDVARLQYEVMSSLGIKKLYASMGGSLGGCLTWELAMMKPDFIEYVIPIASDWKSSDWIVGHNSVQESILQNSKKPLEDARKMAMLFYRTPHSLGKKFERTLNEKGERNVASWLNHHGEKLKSRFAIESYLMMNNLLSTVNALEEDQNPDRLKSIKSKVIQISIDTDFFFIADENSKTAELLDSLNVRNEHHIVKSIHGHDAFLIEHDQITGFLEPVFSEGENRDVEVENRDAGSESRELVSDV